MEELTKIIRKMVTDIAELEESTLSDGQRFAEMGLDSLQALELLVSIERRFGCEIPQDELRHFTDVTSVVQTVYPFVQPALGRTLEAAR
ncbi:MAG TPA: acyl carrier protein [Vicinamibacteria bacterium]|jgi:acyl carrier protein